MRIIFTTCIYLVLATLILAAQIEVSFKFVEIDESDFDVVKAELKAGRLQQDFEGLNVSAVPSGFWKKIQSFPGADILSAPKAKVHDAKTATISIEEEISFAEEFLENGEPAGPLQKRNLGIKVITTPRIAEKGISVEVDANFVKRVGEREVPHGSVPIFRSRSITTRVILPENTPVMIGGFSDNGRRALIICQAKITNNKEAQP